jgi:hypothetical protein
MAYEVTVETLGPRTLAALHRRVAMYDIGKEFRPALDTVWASSITIRARRSCRSTSASSDDPAKLETTIQYLLR